MGKVGKITLFGLTIRLVTIFQFSAYLQKTFYAPFLNSVELNLDPWKIWTESGGQVEAFPYGLPMLLVHLPAIFLGNLIELFGAEPTRAMVAGSILVVVVSEMLIVRVLNLRKIDPVVISFFYLNPLVIYLNFIVGVNDIVPAALLVVSAHFFLQRKSGVAGIYFGFAIGMKLSLILVLPLFAVFAIGNPRARKLVNRFLRFLLLAAGVSYLPLIYSASMRTSISSTLKSNNLLELSISAGNLNIRLLPLVYMFLAHWLWRVGRTSIETLIMFAGIALLAISTANPGSPGWLLWSLPLILMTLPGVKYSHFAFLGTFMFFYFLLSLSPETSLPFSVLQVSPTRFILDLALTCTIGCGAILVGSFLKQSLAKGDLYNFGGKPLVISLAGDSGVGKDKLANTIRKTFGAENVLEICGDDFHRFERNHPAWNRVTHLDPNANNLNLWAENLRLARMRKVFSQDEYDHKHGKFNPAITKPKADLVISQGLHALYPIFHELADLNIFISMDEEVRIKFKMSRDIEIRGKSPKDILNSISARREDSVRFIEPQILSADLLIEIFKSSTDSLDVRFSSRNQVFIHILDEILIKYEIPHFLEVENVFNGNAIRISPESFTSENGINILKSELMSYNQMFQSQVSFPENLQGVLTLCVFLMLDWKVGLK